MKWRATLLAMMMASLLWPGAARAQICIATATGVIFGAYAPVGGGNLTTTGTATVTCTGLPTQSVSYTIALGTGASGRYTTRTLAGTTTPLNYQLYTNALYSQVWGDGSAGTVTVTDSYTLANSLPLARNYTIYGRALSGQNVVAGTYLDTLNVTVSY